MGEAIEEDVSVNLYLCLHQALTWGHGVVGSTNLRLHQYQVNEEHYIVVLNILVRKPLTAWTLRQSDVAITGGGSLRFTIWRRTSWG